MKPTAAELFSDSEDVDQFRSVVRSFLAANSDDSARRQAMGRDLGYDPAVWRRMCDELGLAGMLVPEARGGAGSTLLEVSIAMEEMGRVLLCSPFLSSAVLSPLAILSVDAGEAGESLLAELAAGRTSTLAFAEDRPIWAGGGIETFAQPDGDRYRITGSKRWVLDGRHSDVLLVLARTTVGLSLFAVDPSGPGVDRVDLPVLDLTRRQADVRFDGAAAIRLGPDGGGERVLDFVLPRARVALAAEQMGGAAAVLESAVAYAKGRVQFGVPIGSFQAVKHRCADMLVDYESARSVAQYAAWAAVHDEEDLPVASAMAAAYCSSAFSRMAQSNIQVHGGIGFTWEHSAHLFLKRAKGSEVLFGSPRHHRQALGDLIGL